MDPWRCKSCGQKNHPYRGDCCFCERPRHARPTRRVHCVITSGGAHAFSEPPAKQRSHPSFRYWRRRQPCWVIVVPSKASDNRFEVVEALYLERYLFSNQIIHVTVEIAGQSETVAAERLFDSEADAQQEARRWNRFLDTIKPSERQKGHEVKHWGVTL